jgi:hypothetical protein
MHAARTLVLILVASAIAASAQQTERRRCPFAIAHASLIDAVETLFEGTFASEHAGQDLAAAIAQWRTTQASDLFAKFVRNATVVDPTLVAQKYVVRLIEIATPDPSERYLAASAQREAAKAVERQHRIFQ